jgi:hypothetical protein
VEPLSSGPNRDLLGAIRERLGTQVDCRKCSSRFRLASGGRLLAR